MTTKVIFLTSGTSWTVPSDWNSANNSIETITKGGNGSSGVGGAGGNYKKYTNVSLTPGATATYDTAAGTHTGLGTAVTSYSGGSPALIGLVSFGGGAAGPGGAGGNASSAGNGTNGAAGAGSWTSTHDASGATSVATAGPGAGGRPPGVYGGGGGYDGRNSYAGAAGIIVVTYTTAAALSPVNLTGAQTTNAVTQTGDIHVVPTGPVVSNVTGAQITNAVTQTSAIAVVSPGLSRILIGKLPSGNNGLRISQSGYDAASHPVDNERLIFSSEWPEAIPVHSQGFGRFNQGSGSSVVATVAFPSLGYVPYVEFVFRSPNDTPLNQSSWPDTSKYYPRQALSIATWAPYNGFDGAEFFRTTITDGQLRFEGERRSSGNGFGQNLSWWIYWTIFKKRVN